VERGGREWKEEGESGKRRGRGGRGGREGKEEGESGKRRERVERGGREWKEEGESGKRRRGDGGVKGRKEKKNKAK